MVDVAVAVAVAVALALAGGGGWSVLVSVPVGATMPMSDTTGGMPTPGVEGVAPAGLAAVTVPTDSTALLVLWPVL